MDDIKSKIRDVIIKVTRDYDIDLSDDTKPLLECGMDSVDFSTVLIGVEDHFGISFTEGDMDRISSVEQIALTVAACIEKRA